MKNIFHKVSSKKSFIVLIITIFIMLITKSGYSQEVTLTAGGDVEWSRISKTPGIYFGIKDYKKKKREDGWHRIPFVATPNSIAHIEKKHGRKLITNKSHHIKSIHYGLKFNSSQENSLYPFRKIASTLQEADIAFVNLETPLSDSARYSGSLRTPTAFVEGLKWSGIDIVSNANNHAFDVEGAGNARHKKHFTKCRD